MSFLQNTIQCIECNKVMNVSTGTFGSGLPNNCPFCKKKLHYEVVSTDWRADENGEIKK